MFKKICLGILALVVIGSAVFFACKKESNIIEKQETSVIKQQKIPQPGEGSNGVCLWWTDKNDNKHGIYAEWEGKGHVGKEDRDRKFDEDVECIGRGLCKFRGGIFGVSPGNTNSSPIYIKDNGTYFIEVSINENIPFEEHFILDEPEIYIDDFGNAFKIHAGNYPFDVSIGRHGGYALPIDVQIVNFE
jgi:hypothetical protein